LPLLEEIRTETHGAFNPFVMAFSVKRVEKDIKLFSVKKSEKSIR